MNDTLVTYGPMDYPTNSPSMPPYPPYTPDNTTTSDGSGGGTDPSALMQINSLAATLSNVGLSWFGTVTQKPIVTATPSGQIVSQAQTSQTQTLIIIGIIAIVAIVLIRK